MKHAFSRHTLSKSPVSEELYPKIKGFLLESASIYGGIGEWWDKKIAPGLRTGERVCNAAIVDDEIAGLCIGKRATGSAKLCTLRIRERYRHLGLGKQLLSSTLQELLSSGCQRVHYTISEEVLNQCSSFF